MKRARTDDENSSDNLNRSAMMGVDDFILLVDALDNTASRIHSRASILKHWEDRKESDPELYRLACILNVIRQHKYQ